MKTRILTNAEVQLMMDASENPDVKKTSSYRSLKSRCKAHFKQLIMDMALISQCAERDKEEALTLFAMHDLHSEDIK